jgi:hypothetical protein
LADVINLNTIEKEFTPEEISELMQFLPKQDTASLKYALEGKGLHEGHL